MWKKIMFSFYITFFPKFFNFCVIFHLKNHVKIYKFWEKYDIKRKHDVFHVMLIFYKLL